MQPVVVNWKNKAFAAAATQAVVKQQLVLLGRGRPSKPQMSPLAGPSRQSAEAAPADAALSPLAGQRLRGAQPGSSCWASLRAFAAEAPRALRTISATWVSCPLALRPSTTLRMAPSVQDTTRSSAMHSSL